MQSMMQRRTLLGEKGRVDASRALDRFESLGGRAQKREMSPKAPHGRSLLPPKLPTATISPMEGSG